MARPFRGWHSMTVSATLARVALPGSPQPDDLRRRIPPRHLSPMAEIIEPLEHAHHCQGLWRADGADAAGSLHSAGCAGGHARRLRRAARPAALPDPQGQHQYPRHSDGAADRAVSGVRRGHALAQSGTGGRISADGGHADRDQVAHAAAAAAQGGGRRGGGSACRTGAPADGVRADEAGRGQARRTAAGRARLRVGRRCGSRQGRPSACRK